MGGTGRGYPARVASDEPASYLTLERGADVISSDGQRVGAVEHVLRDEATDIFDGLVIDIRTGPGGLRFVDAPDVGEIRDRAVQINVPAAEVDRLPEPSANPAVMEHHGAEDFEGKLEHKLRRAWEIVSGRG
jgi:PRC-barrel domain